VLALKRKVWERAVSPDLKFRKIFDSNTIGIVFGSTDGSLTEVNDYYLTLLGYSREEMEQGAFRGNKITPAEYRHLDRKALEEARLSGLSDPYEKPYIRKDGSMVWVLIRVATVDRGRDRDHMVAYVLDITAFKKAEEALRESEKKFRMLAEFIPQLVWSKKKDGEVDYFNERWAAYTGISQEDSMNRGWRAAIHPEDVEALDLAWEESERAGTSFMYDYRLKSADGEFRWFTSRSLPVRNENGEIVRWFGTCTDIHDEKMSLNSLKFAKEEAEAATRLKSSFLANMSHEIRTPLSAILGFTDLLRDTSLSPQDRDKFHEIVRRNGEQLLGLIDDILDLSRVESGQFKIENVPTSLEEMKSALHALLAVKAQVKDLELLIEIDPAVPNVIGTDPLRIKQILVNLLGNAIKFTDKGSVRLNVRMRPSGLICFLVSDTGMGISTQLWKNLFKPFSQCDPSITRKFGGTGLGLALSKQLAKSLGGDLILKSSVPGMGSVFELTIENRIQSIPVNLPEFGNSSKNFFSPDPS
jgi:PAS domain S-box-containing protein